MSSTSGETFRYSKKILRIVRTVDIVSHRRHMHIETHMQTHTETQRFVLLLVQIRPLIVQTFNNMMFSLKIENIKFEKFGQSVFSITAHLKGFDFLVLLGYRIPQYIFQTLCDCTTKIKKYIKKNMSIAFFKNCISFLKI